MTPDWPRAWGPVPGKALIRCYPEDFQVSEELGFELSGEGELCFLYLQKRELNSLDVRQRLCALSGVAPRDIGFCGLKDRNALTRQWFSVGLAGRAEPDWQGLEALGDVKVLAVGRHRRKLRRGVHKANRFTLVLREVEGERSALELRLQIIRDQGVPNYFGEQRFGRNGTTLQQARRWMGASRSRVSRDRRGLYLSALRAYVFNELLARRVTSGEWNVIRSGDICVLRGTRSHFACDDLSEDIQLRTATGDISPGLPLWGNASPQAAALSGLWREALPASCRGICDHLEAAGLEQAWRPARLLPDDFSWQFCDDGALQLDFALGAGGFATALLAEFVQHKMGHVESERGSEQD